MNKPGSQIKQTNNHRNLSLFHFDGLISKLRSVWRFLFVPASVWKESNLVASAWTPDQTNISIPICFIWANWGPLSVIFFWSYWNFQHLPKENSEGFSWCQRASWRKANLQQVTKASLLRRLLLWKKYEPQIKQTNFWSPLCFIFLELSVNWGELILGSFQRSTIAAFGNFRPKSTWDKSQNLGTNK